jgi:hypothetical protein
VAQFQLADIKPRQLLLVQRPVKQRLGERIQWRNTRKQRCQPMLGALLLLQACPQLAQVVERCIAEPGGQAACDQGVDEIGLWRWGGHWQPLRLRVQAAAKQCCVEHPQYLCQPRRQPEGTTASIARAASKVIPPIRDYRSNDLRADPP